MGGNLACDDTVIDARASYFNLRARSSAIRPGVAGRRLQRANVGVRVIDARRAVTDEGDSRLAHRVPLPMHTATRLASPLIGKARAQSARAPLRLRPLSPLNADWLRSLGVNDVLGGEFERS